MKKWKFFCGGLAALAGRTPNLKAQDFHALHPLPVIPSPAAAAAGLPSAAATAGPPPGGPTLWSFLGVSKPQIDVIRIKVCQTPLGRLMNNSLAPVGALSVGMLGGCCPAINPADLLKPPDSAEGLAARIKAEELDAKARRAAVRYLGTVDCRWFPEAEEVLINSLRKDRNECVRMEAALALSRGCCCTKKVVAALTETVEGGKKIGPVPENSERVKAIASGALSHCIACLEAVVVPVEEVPIKGRDIPIKPKDVIPLPPPDKLPNTLGRSGSETDVQVTAFRQIEATPISQLREQARHALGERKQATDKVVVSAGNVKADHSLYSVLVNARKGGTRPAAVRQEARLPGNPGMVLEEMGTPAPPAAQTPAAATTPTPAMPSP